MMVFRLFLVDGVAFYGFVPDYINQASDQSMMGLKLG
jgi:hypothetical protein